MASTERIFFAGVATTVLLIGAGFGGGVLLGKSAMSAAPQTKVARIKSDDAPPPPARVVLPAVREASQSVSAPAPVPPVQAAIPKPPEQQASSQPEPQVIPATDIQKQDAEKEAQVHKAGAGKHQADHADRRRKTADERQRRHRLYAEKARLQAAREQQYDEQEQHEQQMRSQPQPFGIMAFDGNGPMIQSVGDSD